MKGSGGDNAHSGGSGGCEVSTERLVKWAERMRGPSQETAEVNGVEAATAVVRGTETSGF